MNVKTEILKIKIEKQRKKIKKVVENQKIKNKDVQQKSKKLDELIKQFVTSI